MSAIEQTQVEARSKFKLTLNAKHDVQWELSVVEGVTEEELDRLRTLAITQHRALWRELIVGEAA